MHFFADRRQLPIGQGGFHSTVLYRHGQRFSFVVDCGGDTHEHRQGLVNAFVESGKDHDILAISHLDWDHISGLSTLERAGVRFANVFLPHVDQQQYARWMILRLSFLNGETDGATLAEAVNTLGGLYGGRYGRPTIVIPGDDEGPPDRFLDEDGGNERYPDVSEFLSLSSRIALNSANSKKSFAAGRSITFERIDWLLRFYSREWICPSEVDVIWKLDVLQPLSKALNDLIAGCMTSDTQALMEPVVAELRAVIPAADANKAIKQVAGKGTTLRGPVSVKSLLGKLYASTVVLKDYNDASLCLYSGPSQRGWSSLAYWFIRRLAVGGASLPDHAPLASSRSRAVGWLHTGDVNLCDSTRLDDFVAHYAFELPLTSVLVLPHHGSRHSYGKSLAELDDLVTLMSDRPLFIANAQPDHKFGHPHAAVTARCVALGTVHIVDRRQKSLLLDSVRATY